MPKLTRYQEDALLVLRTRLNPSDPNNTASEEVKAHLRAILPWLDAWVLPAVDLMGGIRGSGRDNWNERATARDALTIRSRAMAQK